MPIDPNYGHATPALNSRQAAMSKELANHLAHWAGQNGVSLPEALGLLEMAKARLVAFTNSVAQAL